DDVMVGVGRGGRGALPLADLRKIRPAVGAAPQINPADDDESRVSWVDPDDIVVGALTVSSAEEEVSAGVDPRVVLSAVGASIEVAVILIHGSVNDRGIARRIGDFDPPADG